MLQDSSRASLRDELSDSTAWQIVPWLACLYVEVVVGLMIASVPGDVGTDPQPDIAPAVVEVG